jgi:hypothetical protein
MKNIKLLSITWSFEEKSDYESSILYRSFIKKNKKENFINIHFNRNNFTNEEKDFQVKYGFQYEYILYKIYLLIDEIKKIESEYIIYSDTTDVACLEDIELINFPLIDSVIFSKEIHRYPNSESVTNWSPSHMYNEFDESQKNYLNSGIFFTKKTTFLELLNECVNNVLKLNYTNFGGDQGVYTYFYINLNKNNLIRLDSENEFFLSTYLLPINNYEKKDDLIYSTINNKCVYFVHDNGWNYGSPKFINYFNL